MSEGFLTVSEAAGLIKSSIDGTPLLQDIRVNGEVSNHVQSASGHHYFVLKDEMSSLRCLMFRYGTGGRFISDGAQIVGHGSVSFYTARGDLQFYVQDVRLYGEGALQKRFEELKRLLEMEGLFDTARKRQIPVFPASIAVITSARGAAVQDIISVLNRRYPIGEVTVLPIQVQGKDAAPSIVKALELLPTLIETDVCILARGGGAIEDLWAFNEESVARAIFACSVPVVTGIGHETDYTIADLVADVRASTPSAAAEAVAPDLQGFATDILDRVHIMQRIVEDRIQAYQTVLDLATDRLFDEVPHMASMMADIENLQERLTANSVRVLYTKMQETEHLEKRLESLVPANVLKRGYSMIQRDGKLISRGADLSTGDILDIIFADGNARAETIETYVEQKKQASSRA